MNRAHLSTSSVDAVRAQKGTNCAVKRRVATRVVERIIERTAPAPSPKEPTRSFAATRLANLSASWIRDCRSRRASNDYLANITFVVDKFNWWCKRENIETVDADALRSFFIYVDTAHELPEGRWGNPGDTRENSSSRHYLPIKASTIKDYKRILNTFCNWIAKQGMVDIAPMVGVGETISRENEVHFDVFTEDESQRVIDAAKAFGPRDHAIALFLLDTGVRATELVSLLWSDMDLDSMKATIRFGKGGKTRVVHWQATTNRALWRYANEQDGDIEARSRRGHVFLGLPGRHQDQPLTRSGLLQITQKWAEKSGVKHCHPHTFRHTYATLYLLSPHANQSSLKEFMGHSSLKQTDRYVRFTQINLETQAKSSSPVEFLRKLKRKAKG